MEATFTKNGRTLKSIPDPSGSGNIGIYYEATPTEFERVKNKTYTTPQGNLSGERYVAEPGDGKQYVLHSSYEKQSNDNYIYLPNPPGQEVDNGNVDLFNAIDADKSIKNQVTGTQLPNTAPTSSDQPSPDGGSSTPVTPPNETKPGNAKGYLIYPLQMRGDQDRIMFHAHEYKSGNRLDPNSAELSPVKYIPVGIKVFLSIQSPISDQNSVGWEPDTLNPLEKFAAGASRRLMGESGAKTDIAAAVLEIYKGAAENLKVEKGAAGEAVRTYLVGQAIGVNNLLSRLQGQVLNPNLELLFQGPQLRPFNFTFKMSARDAAEAKEIKDIIQYFKKNMATKKSKTGIFLQAPNVFKIQYQYGDNTPHKSLNLIKMCALTNCSIDYTPLGSYMTYDDPDKTMVAYTMSLQFQELTPIYDTDYEEFSYGEEKGQTIKVQSENFIGP